jgi:hypothetical protein
MKEFSFEIPVNVPARPMGWVIQVHPDFFWNTSEVMFTELARSIRQEQEMKKRPVVMTGLSKILR